MNEVLISYLCQDECLFSHCAFPFQHWLYQKFGVCVCVCEVILSPLGTTRHILFCIHLNTDQVVRVQVVFRKLSSVAQ